MCNGKRRRRDVGYSTYIHNRYEISIIGLARETPMTMTMVGIAGAIARNIGVEDTYTHNHHHQIHQPIALLS